MASAPAKAAPLTNGKLKLMICDDSNIIRRKIERELQIERLQVIATAANGKQAVEAFRKDPADVVTMDITMPEMDGIECVEHIIKIKSDVLILVVSALAVCHAWRGPAQDRLRKAALVGGIRDDGGGRGQLLLHDAA